MGKVIISWGHVELEKSVGYLGGKFKYAAGHVGLIL
jgi:hypothetical protein